MQITSSLPVGSVIVAVFTIGWSIPSINTQFPAGTRFNSTLYLNKGKIKGLFL
jgi:hypothetical protein